MRATIDAAGRLVVPKLLRDALGLRGGEDLDMQVRDGRLEIEVAATPVTLEEVDGRLRAHPERRLPPLTTAQVRDTLEQTRR